MKATLEFNLPEEREEYELTLQASKMSLLIWHFENDFLRANLKYGIGHDLLHEIKKEVATVNEYSSGEDRAEVPTELDIELVLEAVRNIWYRMKDENDVTSI